MIKDDNELDRLLQQAVTSNEDEDAQTRLLIRIIRLESNERRALEDRYAQHIEKLKINLAQAVARIDESERTLQAVDQEVLRKTIITLFGDATIGYQGLVSRLEAIDRRVMWLMAVNVAFNVVVLSIVLLGVVR